MIDIVQLRPKALAKAQSFIGTTEVLRELGWGVSGIVFMAPDLTTAIKVHHRRESFQNEARAYRLLRSHRVTSMMGITIPKLRYADEERMLIAIDIVRPPFLLDFAGVQFVDPGFSEQTIIENREDVELRFGRNAHLAFAVQHALLQFGIYYLDLRRGNLNLDGHPAANNSPEDDES